VKGRLSYVGDYDCYAINVPANTEGRLHYQVTLTGVASRFPAPVPTLQPRELTAEVNYPSPAWSTCDCCSSGCAGYCARGLCLRSRRIEDPQINQRDGMLANFQGLIRMPSKPVGYKFLVEFAYSGAAGADDLEYQINFADLPQDADQSVLSIPNATGGTGTADVVIGYGVGGSNRCLPRDGILGCYRTVDRPSNNAGLVPWGLVDYDAEMDNDAITVQFPAGLAPGDYTWGLSWQIQPASGQSASSRANDVVLDIGFLGREIAYGSGATDPWCKGVAGADGGPGNCPRANLFSFDKNTGTFALTPAACLCIHSRYIAAGSFTTTVAGVNRAAWADSRVTLSMSLSAYPPPASGGGDGGPTICPVPCGL
jgi:hypothetical protein